MLTFPPTCLRKQDQRAFRMCPASHERHTLVASALVIIPRAFPAHPPTASIACKVNVTSGFVFADVDDLTSSLRATRVFLVKSVLAGLLWAAVLLAGVLLAGVLLEQWLEGSPACKRLENSRKCPVSAIPTLTQRCTITRARSLLLSAGPKERMIARTNSVKR